MAVFWDAVQGSLVDIDQRFRGAYCLNHQGVFFPTEFICRSGMILRKYSDNSPKRHSQIDVLMEMRCVLLKVEANGLNVIWMKFVHEGCQFKPRYSSLIPCYFSSHNVSVRS